MSQKRFEAHLMLDKTSNTTSTQRITKLPSLNLSERRSSNPNICSTTTSNFYTPKKTLNASHSSLNLAKHDLLTLQNSITHRSRPTVTVIASPIWRKSSLPHCLGFSDTRGFESFDHSPISIKLSDEQQNEVESLINRVKLRLKQKDEMKKKLMNTPRRPDTQSPTMRRNAFAVKANSPNSCPSKVIFPSTFSEMVGPLRPSSFQTHRKSHTEIFHNTSSLKAPVTNATPHCSILKKSSYINGVVPCEEDAKKEVRARPKSVKFGNEATYLWYFFLLFSTRIKRKKICSCFKILP